jgi:virginiamycin B lyase
LLGSAILGGCGGGTGSALVPTGGARIEVVQQRPSSLPLKFPLLTANAGPSGIAVGSDSSYWVTEGAAGKIARVLNTGAVTEFPYHLAHAPSWAAPGGGVPYAAWAVDTKDSVLAGITSAGVPAEHALPANASPTTVFVDSTGIPWLTEPAANAVVDTTNFTISSKYTTHPLPAGSAPLSIVQGPDKNMWVTEPGTGAIAKIAHSGSPITQYPLPAGRKPTTIVSYGAYLWFGESTSSGGAYLARMTTAGALSEYPVPGGAVPQFIAAGPLSAIWYSTNSGQLAYATIGTKVTFAPAVATLGAAVPIVEGKDGNIWFPDSANDSVDVYVVYPLTVTPTSIAFTAIAQQQTFTVSETHYTGAFTTTSSNSAVASVSPASGQAFSVTANGPGTATITVSDNPAYPKVGNGTVISVTVTTTSISLN